MYMTCAFDNIEAIAIANWPALELIDDPHEIAGDQSQFGERSCTLQIAAAAGSDHYNWSAKQTVHATKGRSD
jgi:hypothetical protein